MQILEQLIAHGCYYDTDGILNDWWWCHPNAKPIVKIPFVN